LARDALALVDGGRNLVKVAIFGSVLLAVRLTVTLASLLPMVSVPVALPAVDEV